MDVILVKTLLLLLIFGLVESNVVEGDPHQKKNKNGTRDGRFLIENSLRAHDMPGFRRVKGFSGKKKKSDCQNTHFKQFFPSWTPPKGLRGNQENIVLICQQKSRYNFNQKADTYYSTLFDQGLGIPVYSAYKLISTDTKYERRPRPTWQENKGIRNQVGKDTYPQAPWQRGHLAPAHTLSSDRWAFRSTFRYTNAVPQHPSFNAGEWSKFERRIRKYAEVCTKDEKGVLYLLSGTAFVSVDNRVKIYKGKVKGVRKEYSPEKRPGEKNTDEIYVPTSLWTAGCCIDSSTNYARKSFAVIGNNVKERGEMHTQQIKVKILQKIMEQDPYSGKEVNLYPNNPGCLKKNLAELPEYVKGDPKEKEEEEEEKKVGRRKKIKKTKKKKSTKTIKTKTGRKKKWGRSNVLHLKNLNKET